MRAAAVLALLLAAGSVAQTPALAPPTVVLDSVQPFGAERQILRVMLAVRLSNPNNFPLELQKLDGLLNDRIAEADSPLARTSIPPVGEVTVEVGQRVTMEQVASALLPLGPREVRYDVSGIALAPGGEGVPFAGRGTARWIVRE
ncbi:MAG TPA: LEA type 2 family protein [Casimicrobiaceae bacterium]